MPTVSFSAGAEIIAHIDSRTKAAGRKRSAALVRDLSQYWALLEGALEDAEQALSPEHMNMIRALGPQLRDTDPTAFGALTQSCNELVHLAGKLDEELGDLLDHLPQLQVLALRDLAEQNKEGNHV